MSRCISLAASLAAATGVFALSALPAASADSGTVNAHVTVASPCITVSIAGGAAALDFGTLAFSQQAPISNNNTDTQLKSCAISGQNISVKGSNASVAGGGTWLLDDSGDPCTGGNANHYSLRVMARSTPSPACTRTPTST